MNASTTHRLLAIASLCMILVAGGCRDGTKAPAASRIAEPVAITALVWAPDWPDEMNTIALQFMQENPDVRVDVQFMIGNSVEENIKPKIAVNHLPDIISINPNAYAAGLAEQGLLIDLSSTRAWHNMRDSLKPDWTSGTHHFGISGGIAAMLLYYNEAMFAAAGITELPSDFTAFLMLCERLKTAGFVPIMWNGGFSNMLGNGPFSVGFANSVVASHPNWKAEIAAGTLALDTPETADIFQKLQLLPARGYTQKNYLHTGYDEGIELFRSGKTAMALHGTWASGLLMHAPGFKTGVMIPPWNARGKRVVPVIGSETGFAICATRNREASLRFLEFMYARGFSIQHNKRQNLSPLKHNDGPVMSDPRLVEIVAHMDQAPVKGSLYYTFLPASTIDMLHPLLENALAGRLSPQAAAFALHQSVRNEATHHGR